MKPGKALLTLSVLLSISSMVLCASRVRGIPACAAVASFVAASVSFSLGAQILSMAALITALIPLKGNALLGILVACSLALVGVITRLALSDVRGYAPRSFAAGNVALMVGMPLVIAPSLASRSLSVAEPLAVVLVSAIASYALGVSYALGRGLRVDMAPIGLRWLRGLSRRMLDKLSGMLAWVILTALVTRTSALAGVPAVPSIAVATLTSLLAVLTMWRSRVGRVALLAACAVASVALLREADVISLGSTLRLVEEVVKHLGW